MMTHLAQIAPFHAASADKTARPSLIARLRRSFGKTQAAMEGQARRADVNAETLRDTRLSPEDLTGAPSYDPALPFFMQSSFGNERF